MSDDITQELLSAISANEPLAFSKYGDGEFICVFASPQYRQGRTNGNDFTPYSNKLSAALRRSFEYMAGGGGGGSGGGGEYYPHRAFMGRWNDARMQKSWEGLVKEEEGGGVVAVRWACYHSLIIDADRPRNLRAKLPIYRAIKRSGLKKFIVCNDGLALRARVLLDILPQDVYIVDRHNWFDPHYEKVLHDVGMKIANEGRAGFIMLTCCGMGAKVLIADLARAFPHGIYLDVGSALDFVCTGRDTRHRTLPTGEPEYDYAYLIRLFCGEEEDGGGGGGGGGDHDDDALISPKDREKYF